MFGSEILEIAVGLALVYLLLSFVVTAVTESVSRLVALRAIWFDLLKNLVNLRTSGVKSDRDDAPKPEPPKA